MRPVILVLVLLAAGCTGDDGERSSAPTSAERATSTTETPSVESSTLLGAETDTTLLVAPCYGPLYALDLDTGVAQAYPDTEGWPGDFDDCLERVGEGVAFPGSGSTRWLPLSLEGPSRSLGRSYYFVPSARPDRVWLVDHDDGRDRDVVREVDSDGVVTTPPSVVPVAGPSVGAQGDDLVVVDAFDLRRFTPGESGAPVISADVFLAASGDLLAITDPCRGCTRLRVIDDDPSTEDVVVDLNGGVASAAFSPDGQWLAIWRGATLVQDGGLLQLVELNDGELRTIPGAAGGAYMTLDWSPDSDWVFALGGRNRPVVTITGYRLGDEGAVSRDLTSLQAGRSIVAVPSVEGPDLDAEDAGPCPRVGGQDHNGNPLPALTTDRPCRVRTG